MKLSEATKLVGILGAYFPSRELPKETVQLWALELEPCDASDAMLAVQDLAQEARFMPSLAELLNATNEHRKLRLLTERGEQPALPPQRFDFEGWVTAQEQMPWRNLIDDTFPEATA